MTLFFKVQAGLATLAVLATGAFAHVGCNSSSTASTPETNPQQCEGMDVDPCGRSCNPCTCDPDFDQPCVDGGIDGGVDGGMDGGVDAGPDGGDGGDDAGVDPCVCACETPAATGGCAQVCTPGFCGGDAGASGECLKCLTTACPGVSACP